MRFKEFLRNITEKFEEQYDYVNQGISDLSSYKWPNIIPGDFNVKSNELQSLEGGPLNVKGSFIAMYNELKSLKGCPLSIGKSFNCSHNKIEKIDDFPKHIGLDADLSYNNLTTLEDIEDHSISIKGKIILSENPIQKKISGLLHIQGLQEVVYSGPNERAIFAFNELNKHIKSLNESKQDFNSKLQRLGLEEFI